MPRISLRAYEKQIEDLIDGNHLLEAIDQCRYILKTFPKCISTYRILGKSFLEGKQYNETADVFKRVLAVFPDDFIAHVGMSIVKENEKDLDAAIWHMELAFDSQPSNIAIQEELKRLFGLRDGTHPAKIRLTRGALVRMYARGELYPQAIAEIKSALIEDPKRLDLNVLLAKMYFLLGDNSEALALSNQLILELPYCFELNKILVALLPASNKSEKTPIYLDRLKSLDPYESFVGEIYHSAEEVPDGQVLIDQLAETEPSEVSSANPEWVRAMESKWEEPSNIETIDWLPKSASANEPVSASGSFQPPSEEPFTQSQNQAIPAQTPAKSEDENKLPDWMRSAGWLPTNDASQPAEPVNNAFSSEKPNNPANPADSGDLPDWLRSLATQESEPSTQADSSSLIERENPSVSSDFSGSQEDLKNEIVPEETKAQDHDAGLPDWLKNFEVESSVESASTDDLPDWMKSIQQNEANTPAEATSAKPAFKEIDAELSLSNLEEHEKTASPSSPPLPEDWKSALTKEPELAEKAPKPENPDIPDWVRSVLQQPVAPIPVEKQPEPVLPDEKDAPNIPEQSTEPEVEETTNPVLSEKSGDDLLSWLRDLKPEDNLSTGINNDNEGTDSETPTDFPVFDDDSPLDRLQQVTDHESGEKADEIESPEKENVEPTPQPIELTSADVKPVLSNSVKAESVLSNLLESDSTEPNLLNSQTVNETIPTANQQPATENPQTAVSAAVSETSNPKKSPSSEKEPASSPIPADSSENTITDLITLTEIHPDDYLIWQQLGDAYAKEDNFYEALRSYNIAEELILKS